MLVVLGVLVAPHHLPALLHVHLRLHLRLHFFSASELLTEMLPLRMMFTTQAFHLNPLALFGLHIHVFSDGALLFVL